MQIGGAEGDGVGGAGRGWGACLGARGPCAGDQNVPELDCGVARLWILNTLQCPLSTGDLHAA